VTTTSIWKWTKQRVDLLDLAILALRILIVALLYLFLLTVLRTTAGGLRAQATPTVPSASVPLRLVVLEGGAANLNAGQVFEVTPAGATLGRAERADIVVADPAVSAEHARLSRVGRAWVITDLDSTNGTRLNEAQVRGRSPLADGDVLALGNVRLQVQAR
jgi:type III secretion system (T3SS) inner membrane Yop/YscD-like protein